MDSALDPLDLVKHSERIVKPIEPSINTEALAQFLEDIAQEAATLINSDYKQEFLYKNPNGWKKKYEQKLINAREPSLKRFSYSSSSISFQKPSSSTSSDEDEELFSEPWVLLENFEFSLAVRQISEFIHSWELTPATKFVVIVLDKVEHCYPFGERYFVEAHFSKPTPKCPNPLAVAKVYFEINVSHLLPYDYPVNVTYKFEGYESQFYAMGEHKINSNKFQRYYIDTILHMKLAFYAELCECHNPKKTL
ncbi:uncharacterized protein ACRADG_007068 [Cochliomyia hominivorax]